jgi:hypothetical protein
MANQLYNRRDHYREQGDRGQRVEYRYGKHYIFHDLGFLIGFSNWTSLPRQCSGISMVFS